MPPSSSRSGSGPDRANGAKQLRPTIGANVGRHGAGVASNAPLTRRRSYGAGMGQARPVPSDFPSIFGRPPAVALKILRIPRDSSVLEEVTPGSWYASSLTYGVSLFLDASGLVNTCFLYPRGRDGFEAYTGRMPGGIVFTMSRDQVRDRLGLPEATSDGGGRALMAWGAWDRYEDIAGVGLHVQYDSAVSHVGLVTITAANRVDTKV